MSIEVFHNNGVGFRFRATGGEGWPESFDKVATVHLPDEQYTDVYRLTNSVEHGWWENTDVEAHTESDAFITVEGVRGTRSTSVGDIIVLSDGRVLECAPLGWTEVSI